jgi:putative ubiquitin-RnfH superfamily antitoxin RatB of RatAB toxin-antitoxin module
MSAAGRPKGGYRRAQHETTPTSEATVKVTVVWATPRIQDVVALTLPAGATVAAAIALSGLLEIHRIDAGTTRAGLHGRVVGDDTALRDGDRVEICRPLVVDPKEARRLRADLRARARAKRSPGK